VLHTKGTTEKGLGRVEGRILKGSSFPVRKDRIEGKIIEVHIPKLSGM